MIPEICMDGVKQMFRERCQSRSVLCTDGEREHISCTIFLMAIVHHQPPFGMFHPHSKLSVRPPYCRSSKRGSKTSVEKPQGHGTVWILTTCISCHSYKPATAKVLCRGDPPPHRNIISNTISIFYRSHPCSFCSSCIPSQFSKIPYFLKILPPRIGIVGSKAYFFWQIHIHHSLVEPLLFDA